MPQRFRLPEKDTRRFYEKPEWWVEFVKWGIVAVLLAGAAGFGATFAMGKWRERRHRLEVAAQEARLRELEEAKEREAREAAAKAEKEAREKARAEARAEKERARRERQDAAEQRRAGEEQRRQELESLEKGPSRLHELEKLLQTAGVRWWGAGTPPKFASRREGDEYWCVFPDEHDCTMVRVKVGADKDTPASIDIADGNGRMRPYERALLEEAAGSRPHLVMMDKAAWVRLPRRAVEEASHVSITEKRSFRPAEMLLGEALYGVVKDRFRSGNRLEKLDCTLTFHWRGDSREPLSWRLEFGDSLSFIKLSRAIEDVLQAELDAANGVTAAKSATNQPERKRSTLTMGGSQLSGGPRAGRRLGEGARSLTGGAAPKQAKQEEAETRGRQGPGRVTGDDVRRVIDEGWVSACFAE